MDKDEKVIAWLTLALAIVLGVSQVYLAVQSNNVNNELYQMQENANRATVSIHSYLRTKLDLLL